MCNFPHRCMWQDWIVLYSLSHHLSAFLTLAVLISNIPSGWNSFFVWIFITRFEFFHYRCILSCFRYTKDSNSFLKQSSYCFSVDLERSVVEAVFNRKIDVKMLRLMFSFFGQVMTFSFILECIIDTLLYTDCHFIISVKLDD